MGVNAQTAVPAFTAGQVLTAAQMTEVNTGIPVFADSTARDAAFGGSGEKVLAEGQFAYIEATNLTQYYDGAAWQNVGVAGLTYITQATPSAVNTISINNCFTSTYANYFIVVDLSAVVGAGSLTARMRLSGTDATTNYTTQRLGGQTTTTFASGNVAGTDEFYIGALDSTAGASFAATMNAFSPALARQTNLNNFGAGIESAGSIIQITYGNHSTATAYDGITFLTTATSMTGTIRVYGYQNS
jgi:hypothetical protein